MGVQLTDEMIKGAQETEKKYGIPTSITLAQILQESGGSYAGGLSGLAFKAKNLFGIKGTGTAGSVNMKTTEYANGKAYQTYANFRAYNSFAESIEDHAKVLTNSRYTQYTSNAKTLEEYAKGIQKGGYATDPNYADELMKQIINNGLFKHDLGEWGTNLSGSHQAEQMQETITENKDTDVKLKLWGNIALFICIVLVVGGAVLFFIKAFDISLSPQQAMLKQIKAPQKEEKKETKKEPKGEKKNEN